MENRIKDILAERGMTALELAGITGLSRVSLSNIINNKQEASANTLKMIAESLKVEFWELFVSRYDLLKGMSDAPNTITCPKCGNQIPVELKVKE